MGSAISLPPPVMQSPLDDAKSIHKAIYGIGTDEATIIQIFGTRSREELVQIRLAYETEYPNTSFLNDVKEDCGGSFGEALISLATPLTELKTNYLFRSMQGVATKDKALIDVLAFSTNEEIQAINQTYQTLYKKSLEEVLNEETAGNFRKALLELIKAERGVDEIDSGEKAKKDAETLYHSGEKRFGTDDDSFIRVLTKSSQPHLSGVSAHYQQAYGKSLVAAIQNETSGDYRDLLKALATPKKEWYAERLNSAIRGIGTHDLRLIYMMTSVDRAERKSIAEFYDSKHKSLKDDISGDLSGDYLNLMLKLLEFN